MFFIDGKEVFLSSSRNAVKNPIRGRRWIGERIIMRMPRETFQRFATAKGTAIRMGATVFEIGEAQKAAMRELLKRMEMETRISRGSGLSLPQQISQHRLWCDQADVDYPGRRSRPAFA